MMNNNYLKTHKLISNSTLFKRYSKYIHSKYILLTQSYPVSLYYNDWFSYLTNFKNFFKNKLNQFVIINSAKYNYNLVKYMCFKKKGNIFSILDFCSAIGIPIPHYCYHPDLSIAGNCRMCLVHIEGSIKPIVSCAIILTPGMIINTNSLFVKKIHESVLEFLLLNHPLDCPTCDRGGECDLQELNLSYGSDRGRIFHKLDLKRSINDMSCNSFIKFTLTRCIYCTRCIRFLNEFDGNSNMGLLGRGNNSEIGLYVDNILNSDLGSNIIELCPVGALTSKLYSFKYRAWDTIYFESIDVTSPSLTPIRLYVKGSKISRVLPQYDESFEWTYLTEKARYIYDAFNVQRLIIPLKKIYNIKTISRQSIYVPISWGKLKTFFLYYNSNQVTKNTLLPILGNSCDLLFINYIKHLFLRNGQNNFLYDEHINIKSYSNYDFRDFYINHIQDIQNINICLLINITLRTENPLLNAKLRQEYLWNNTKIFQFGSKYNCAYKYAQLANNTNNLYNILNGKKSNLISFCLKQSTILCITSTLNLSLFTFNFLNKLKIMFNKKNINFNLNINPTQIEQIGLFETNILSKVHCNVQLNKNYLYFCNTNIIYKKDIYLNSNYSIYQSSHFNNNFNCVDLFIPITTFFETRTKLYINSLGLLRRVPKIVPFYKLDIFDDLDSLYFITLFLPLIKIKLNSNNLSNNLYFDLPIKLYYSIINNNTILKHKLNNNFIFKNYYYNTLFVTLYKNFYKTNHLDFVSSTMTTLTNIFFNKNSNFY